MTGRPPLVTLDYPGRREDGRIADLALHEHGFWVRHLLDAPLPEEVTAGAYAGRLLDRIEPEVPVAAVLAYCLAGPIAHEVAVLLTARQPSPPLLVLIDAGLGGPDAVIEAYTDALVPFPGLPGPAAERLGVSAMAIKELLGPDPAGLVERMRAELAARASAELVEDGENPDEAAMIGAQVADHHLPWVRHLVAAASARTAQWPGTVLHVMSRDHPFDGDWPGARQCHSYRMDLSRRDLLRADSVREFLLPWLSGAVPAGT